MSHCQLSGQAFLTDGIPCGTLGSTPKGNVYVPPTVGAKLTSLRQARVDLAEGNTSSHHKALLVASPRSTTLTHTYTPLHHTHYIHILHISHTYILHTMCYTHKGQCRVREREHARQRDKIRLQIHLQWRSAQSTNLVVGVFLTDFSLSQLSTGQLEDVLLQQHQSKKCSTQTQTDKQTDRHSSYQPSFKTSLALFDTHTYNCDATK